MLAERAFRRAAYELATAAARFPAAALPAARALGHGVVVDDRTDLVIEGFPRSGNSLAVAAFAAVQPQPVRVAHHTHSPANVLAAVRRGVPALVVVRAPQECVVDFLLIRPALGAGPVLRGYVRFHDALLPHVDALVVATHEQVTERFGEIVDRLNARFGTRFARFEASPEAVAAAGRGMEGYWAARVGHGLPFVGRSRGGARPAEGDRDRAIAQYLSPRLAVARARADVLHRAFRSVAV